MKIILGAVVCYAVVDRRRAADRLPLFGWRCLEEPADFFCRPAAFVVARSCETLRAILGFRPKSE